jgi:hypothetical protein
VVGGRCYRAWGLHRAIELPESCGFASFGPIMAIDEPCDIAGRADRGPEFSQERAIQSTTLEARSDRLLDNLVGSNE